MTANEIRKTFLDFFEQKNHQIVDSAPIVNKSDPTLLFVNAGMNQFKDYFLGNKVPSSRRIADTQKCLRVSGKHNDLEEVGIDSYHHTLFEMLGNWSFGDYFKEEAIQWAWELLTEVYRLPKDRLYASIFEGDKADGLEPDYEAKDIWRKYMDDSRILSYDRKDNFWEMGETGPCGPCSEIHIDLRSDEERKAIDGAGLVNKDHPLVIEIWNLVFIQFNRKADGSLEELPEKHIDTGMGFERLAMAIQGKTSNYDTDVFMPMIRDIEKASGIKYGFSYDLNAKSDIAMRVVADHVRAVAIAISDGQLPSNTGAGYVIRRILRRAVRYYYSFLNIQEEYLHRLVNPLAEFFKDIFPELYQQKDFVTKVIKEEEKSFLRTLSSGLKRFEKLAKGGSVSGTDAFELYDTYGFPIDLTLLMANEKGIQVDKEGFNVALEEQKNRSKADAQKQVGDWLWVDEDKKPVFIGYDELNAKETEIIRYREVNTSKGKVLHVVLSLTPFYPEGGGQVGDTGILLSGEEKIIVQNTIKENDLIIHQVDRLPTKLEEPMSAQVHASKRQRTEKNHTATHLLHASLRKVLGEHVHQKGSLLNEKYLRFDFSHFQKVTAEEILEIEKLVNEKIMANIELQEDRRIPIEEAKDAGAMMLFGEKYGDVVRMITFDPEFSRELCGGTHVEHTGDIGFFKITTETSVAAGVRRIEAITGEAAFSFVTDQLNELRSIKSMLNNPAKIEESIEMLLEENKALKKNIEKQQQEQAQDFKKSIRDNQKEISGVKLIKSLVPIQDSKLIKSLSYELENELGPAVILLGAEIEGKPFLSLQISQSIIDEKNVNAGSIIRELAKNIQGGGGGQPFFATAGGKNADGLDAALEQIDTFLS
jgi:alanyl-tRNA synthetase